MQPSSTARRPSQARVVFKTTTLRRTCLWTARRQTERVLGADCVGCESG